MDRTEAEAILEKLAGKPKYFFIYDIEESYAHEMEEDDDYLGPLEGGVEDATYIQTGGWYERPTMKITVEVEYEGHEIFLTRDAYLTIKDREGNTIANKPYGLDETRFIMDVWEERFKAIQS